jgi:hypothetical protein
MKLPEEEKKNGNPQYLFQSPHIFPMGSSYALRRSSVLGHSADNKSINSSLAGNLQVHISRARPHG